VNKIDQPDYKPVYIFGAGTSQMIGGPLLKNFMGRARELRYNDVHKRNESLIKAFDNVFNYQAELSKSKTFIGADLDNLESLFSMMDMDWKTEAIYNSTRYEELCKLREDFFSLVIQTLKASIVKSNSNWSLYSDIINYLAQPAHSTFITFNYDLAIETVLNDALENNGYPRYITNYGIDYHNKLNHPSQERLVLKLHGSANWVYCKGCENFFPSRDGYILPSELANSNDSKYHKDKCKSYDKLINVIIPPTWNKLDYTKSITEVWLRSIEEISQATHLFIIGYSFPRTDIFFDQLMGLALRSSKNLKKVIVVNPAKDVDEILNSFFEKHFRDNRVLFIPRYFSEIRNFKNSYDLKLQKDMNAFIDGIKI
jgi:hypothetical protein